MQCVQSVHAPGLEVVWHRGGGGGGGQAMQGMQACKACKACKLLRAAAGGGERMHANYELRRHTAPTSMGRTTRTSTDTGRGELCGLNGGDRMHRTPSMWLATLLWK